MTGSEKPAALRPEGTGVRSFWKNGAIAFLGLVVGAVPAAGFLWVSNLRLWDSWERPKLLGALVLLGLGPAAALAIADLLQAQLSPRRSLVGTLVCAAAAPTLAWFSFFLMDVFKLDWGGLLIFTTAFLVVAAEVWRRP